MFSDQSLSRVEVSCSFRDVGSSFGSFESSEIFVPASRKEQAKECNFELAKEVLSSIASKTHVA